MLDPDVSGVITEKEGLEAGKVLFKGNTSKALFKGNLPLPPLPGHLFEAALGAQGAQGAVSCASPHSSSRPVRWRGLIVSTVSLPGAGPVDHWNLLPC